MYQSYAIHSKELEMNESSTFPCINMWFHLPMYKSESVCGQREHKVMIREVVRVLSYNSFPSLRAKNPCKGHIELSPFITHRCQSPRPRPSFSVDPTDWHPLRRGSHLVHGLFQFLNRFINIIVHNFQVKIMAIGFLQKFTFSCKPFQTNVL